MSQAAISPEKFKDLLVQMASSAAPQYFSFFLRGRASGQTYACVGYSSAREEFILRNEALKVESRPLSLEEVMEKFEFVYKAENVSW